MQGTMQATERHSGNNLRQGAIQVFGRPASRDALDLLDQFGTTVAVQHEHEIHGQGAAATSCYRVISGCVRVVRLMEDGRRQVGEFLMAGDVFGFDALDTHDFAAEAVSDAVLRRYPRRMVDALAETNVGLARRLRDLTSVSLRNAHTRLLLLGRKTASERIASFLLEMAARSNADARSTIELPMSRSDVGDYLGLTIETVCRRLTRLRLDGTIAINGTKIAIRNHAALGEAGCERVVH
jgi:CRP/FNR family nitrogen fixation transcriptional regulator